MQIEFLEMKVKQLELNTFQNLYLMTMNSSQVNGQLQAHAFMMQNCQMQQLYAFSLQAAGRFQPPVLNYNPFYYNYPENLIPPMAQFNPAPSCWHPMPQAQFPLVVPPPPVVRSGVPPFNIPSPPVFNTNVPPPNVPPFPVIVNTGNQMECNSGNTYSRQRQAETTRLQLEKHLDSPVSRHQRQINVASHSGRMVRSVVREDCLIPPSDNQLSSHSSGNVASVVREDCLIPPSDKQSSSIATETSVWGA